MRQFKNTQTITDRSSIAINEYLRDLSNYSMVSMDEEVELARKIRAGGREAEKAKKRLIEANLRFVVSIANQYHANGMELGDIISEGNIGLIRAAERFDDTKGFKFISYAVWWIRQAINAAISAHGRVIRIPNNQLALLQLYKQLCAETQQTEQRKPTLEEFADFADIDVEKARMLLEADVNTISSDTPMGEDNDTSIGDMLSSDYRTDELVDQESLHQDLINTMNKTLKPRECEIIVRSFGLNGKEESLEMIGADMGLSRERVRQIREFAIGKLHDDSDLLFRYLG